MNVTAMTGEGISARGATTEELVAESGEGDLLPAEELDEIEPYAEATEAEPGWTDDDDDDDDDDEGDG